MCAAGATPSVTRGQRLSEDDPLLLEQRVERGEDLYVRRVTTGGEVWTRSHLPRALGGLEATETGNPQWERLATLPDAALSGLRHAIADSGILEAPPSHDPPVAVIHGTTETWTAELDGRRNTTTVRGLPATEVASVQRVESALIAALAAADDAE